MKKEKTMNQDVLNKAIEIAMTASGANKPDRLVSDEEVEERILEFARRGYIPSHQVFGPVRAYMSGFGVMISGDVGSGKTYLMKMLHSRIYECKSIVGYRREVDVWYDATDRYEVCLDDLGAEPTTNDYGEKDDIMKHVIAHRCNLKVRTCMTSNLSAPEIIERYSERTMSRIKGMCKTFEFTGDSMRKARRVR